MVNRILAINVPFVAGFILVLFLSLFFFPLADRIPRTWIEDFEGNRSWQEYGLYTDESANISLATSRGRLTMSQWNTTGDAWVYFNIVQNVTELVTDFQLEAKVMWINGSGTYNIGVLTDGKDSMNCLFFNGYLKKISLGKGYTPIYIPPIVYQPTAGWHTITLSRENSIFRIFYDGILQGEARGEPYNLPVVRILFGVGYDSASDFDYIKLTYFNTEEMPGNKIILWVFMAGMIFTAIGLSYLNFRKLESRRFSVVPVFVCSLYVGIISYRLFGANEIGGTPEGFAKLMQWCLSVILTMLVFFISYELRQPQQQADQN
jgi:hypothetical protein